MSSPPTTLGQYQIIREIARSNDIVYEAYDPLMNRRVAVKELMMPKGSTGPQQDDRVSRFKREAQAAGTLNHPNIMTVYSFAEDAGRTFMAMEYLDGQTLRNDIDTKGSILTERAVEIAEAVLSGLSHAHSKGVIHRDIKPDNIQILSNGTVKITDFGIARLTFQPNLTMDGQVFGTPSYMSPEQVVGRDIDARSDLFSVAVMLYEMLTGRKPFSGDSVVTITYAIMNAEPEQPQNVQWALWQVIERALAKTPAMRYSSADDMRRALEEALRPSPSMPAADPSYPYTYPPSANPYTTPTPPVSQPPPNPMMSAGVGNVIQAPYNPYSTPAANANPYAGQYVQVPPPPPATYPYNPFQNPQGGGLPPPGMIAPIYNPPLPRVPVLSPETSLFIRKFVLALLIVGTLAAVLVISIQAIVDMVGRSDTIRSRVAQGRTDAEKAAEAAKEGKDVESELDRGNAIEKDPNNPENHLSLAQLYWNNALKAADPPAAAELFLKSADEYKSAADNSIGSDKTVAGNGYASAALNAGTEAQLVHDSNLNRDVRSDLNGARAYVNDDPNLQAKIDDMISRLGA
jgi:serine/threonine protein kinase